MRHALACIALAAACHAHAATPIDETRPLDARGALTIENVKGAIQVRAWDRAEVRIEGTLGDGVEKLDITGDARALSVRVRYPNRGGGLGVFTGGDRSGPSTLRLMVPLRAALNVEAVSADVDVEGLADNEWSIDSVSGDVRAVGAPKQAEIESVSGDITATLNSDDVDLNTVSGRVLLRGRLGGAVDVETVAGDVDIDVHPQSRVRTLSGAAVSGDQRVRAALAADGAMEFESVSGDITLQLPRDTSARVEANTFSGDLDVAGARTHRAEHGPGRSVDHRFGNGNGSIEIETFSGDARVTIAPAP